MKPVQQKLQHVKNYGFTTKIIKICSQFHYKKLIVYFTVASQCCKESLFYMILNKKLA